MNDGNSLLWAHLVEDIFYAGVQLHLYAFLLPNFELNLINVLLELFFNFLEFCLSIESTIRVCLEDRTLVTD